MILEGNDVSFPRKRESGMGLIPACAGMTGVFLALFVMAGCARVQPYAPISTAVISPRSAGFYHTVAAGQTLYRIAKTYNVDVSDLMRANHIYNPSQLMTGQRLLIPSRPAPSFIPTPRAPSYEPVTLDKARAIVGGKKYTYRWDTITVHHSATLKGSAKLFDRDHKRRHMGGLFYHFVIGNGSYTGNGAAEVGWRWKKQVKANRPYDIQICLVGDFSKQTVSEAQFNTLVNVITVLQEEYNIPVSRIRKHEDIKGKHTECPGRNFPFDRLLTSLSFRRTK